MFLNKAERPKTKAANKADEKEVPFFFLNFPYSVSTKNIQWLTNALDLRDWFSFL